MVTALNSHAIETWLFVNSLVELYRHSPAFDQVVNQFRPARESLVAVIIATTDTVPPGCPEIG